MSELMRRRHCVHRPYRVLSRKLSGALPSRIPWTFEVCRPERSNEPYAQKARRNPKDRAPLRAGRQSCADRLSDVTGRTACLRQEIPVGVTLGALHERRPQTMVTIRDAASRAVRNEAGVGVPDATHGVADFGVNVHEPHAPPVAWHQAAAAGLPPR